jgi:hypothetical protein
MYFMKIKKSQMAEENSKLFEIKHVASRMYLWATGSCTGFSWWDGIEHIIWEMKLKASLE